MSGWFVYRGGPDKKDILGLRRKLRATIGDFDRSPYVDAMNSENIPILYVKPGCPWCHEVTEFLDEHGISHREVNVMTDESGFAEMRRKSGQSRVPTLDWHGEILADFGVDELVPFLHSQQVEFEES